MFLVLCWHGVRSSAVAAAIAATGLANLRSTDPGYHGSGRYVTLNAEYAAKYASQYPWPVAKENGSWSMVLCVGVVGVDYPYVQ